METTTTANMSQRRSVLSRSQSNPGINRKDGFTATFGGGKRFIWTSKEKAGVLDRGSRKVYRVDNEEGAASVAEEVPTSDQLHRCMGHISFQATKELVKNKLTAGVHLECIPSSQPFLFFFENHVSIPRPRGRVSQSP